MCSWVVFNFFKYTEQTEDEVNAVHYQLHPNQTNKRSLVVAHPITYTTFVATQIHHRTLGSREPIVPCSGWGCSARDEGGEEIVEGEGESGGPGAYEKDFGKSVSKFAGGAPKAERSAKVF
jgi:hypothetical protein